MPSRPLAPTRHRGPRDHRRVAAAPALAGARALLFFAILGLGPAARGEEEPTRWEQIFFPFPIVGAPPQLEQQVQLFSNYFRGQQGQGDTMSAELAVIATAHLGLVLDVPYQIGLGGQPSGFQDVTLLAQYLLGGSLHLDDLISVGLQATLPTAQHDLGAGAYYLGPFAYAGQRLWRHLIVEANLTALLPVVHGDSAHQLLTSWLLAALLTPVRFTYPLYAQVELDTTTYLGGHASPSPETPHSPAQTTFLAPEIFLGPFPTLVSDGTRVAAGVFFNLQGDPVHDRTYSITVAFDIPNRFGY
ncbi:MAG: hypothetical protein ABSB49_00655 [Polyangia bacterium]|jgi:hypothetical protein